MNLSLVAGVYSHTVEFELTSLLLVAHQSVCKAPDRFATQIHEAEFSLKVDIHPGQLLERSVRGHSNGSINIDVGELELADNLRFCVVFERAKARVCVTISCDAWEEDLIQVLCIRAAFIHLVSAKPSKMVVTGDLEQDSVVVLLDQGEELLLVMVFMPVSEGSNPPARRLVDVHLEQKFLTWERRAELLLEPG